MSISKYFIVLIPLFALYSCAGLKTSSLPASDTSFSRPEASSRKTITESEPVPSKHLRDAVESMKSDNGEAALLVLRRTMEQYPNTPWYRRALFLTLRVLIQLDSPEAADAAMLRVQAEYPELADYAVFILAEYHADQGRYTSAASLYQGISERHPKTSLASQSLFRRAQALLESDAYQQAEEAFAAFLQDNPRSEYAPSAGLGLARALYGQERLADAIQAYHDVLVVYAGSSVEQDVELELSELQSKKMKISQLSVEELYNRGKNLYRARQFDLAAEVFTKLLGKKESLPYRSEVLLLNGVSLFHAGRRGDAASVLEKMVKQYPADSRVPEAMHWIGRSYSKLGEWEKGITTFQRIVERFPESEWADDALFLMGNIYRETGDIKKTLHCYGRLEQEYPRSKFADSALWWRAWASYTAGDYRKAEQILRELVARYPSSFLVHQARYWLGRAAENLWDIPRAAAYYRQVLKRGPYTFYGYRAAERMPSLEVPESMMNVDVMDDNVSLCSESVCPDDQPYSQDTDEGPPVWTEETRELLAAEPSFRRTLELMYVDLKKEAAAELWSLQEKMPRKRGALIGLSKAFFELGDYYRSHMLIARKYEKYLEAPQSGAPEDLWRLAYPQAYWDRIHFYARKYNQDPYFIAAIMREESQFKTEALSPAGARGLMQVMPSTGAMVAKQIKMPGFTSSKLYEADTAINIGMWYVSYLMKRFKGDTLLVAAAYNAGPDAVASWIRKNGRSSDRDVFVESIPFMETRGYVKKVLRNYAEYRRIYGRTTDNVRVDPVLPIDMVEASVSGREGKRIEGP